MAFYSALRMPSKRAIPLLGRITPVARPREFSNSALLSAREANHYEELGVPRSASRKEIQGKFYELSKLYHPDAPSTSASGSLESRTAKFQAISQSYAILSDDSARRQYDQTTEGSFGRRPGYTTGGGHEAGGRSGFGGGNAAWSPTAGDNAARRERANYAWSHPRRNRMGGDGNPSASAERAAPLRNRPGEGPATNTQDLFSRFAAREVRSRARAAANRHHTSARDYNAGTSGTEGFGSKAAEESRLINESGVKRSGQVFFVFAGTFAVGVMFAGAGKHDRGRA